MECSHSILVCSFEVSVCSFICSSSDEEDEDLSKHKDNILLKDRKRKRHDAKKKVLY